MQHTVRCQYHFLNIPSDILVVHIMYKNSHLGAVLILWVMLLNILLRLFSLPYVCLMRSQVKWNKSKLAFYRNWSGELEKGYTFSSTGNTAGLGMWVFRHMIVQYMLENFFFMAESMQCTDKMVEKSVWLVCVSFHEGSVIHSMDPSLSKWQ